MRASLLLQALLTTTSLFAADPAPRSLDPRLKIELFAEHPQIVTPTGIDVDHTGRVWAIESNTHFRPENYDGHATDRVLVMTDTNGDGRADKIVVFADGLTHTMSIAVKPVWLELGAQTEKRRARNAERGTEDADADRSAFRGPSSAFLATRDAIWLLHDDDGDLRADRRERLVQLETPGDYPHNGLGGFAFDALGWMYFGFGENLGKEYKIIGSDGTTLSGGGEGGNLYRCRPDGTELSRRATGFWNPHASCVDAFGRLFTVDNDPDSRPPCRLLHIIPGGDYGYRFRNGRKGLHPFTSWNGEIPGTLPMVAGTGEAPSGIIAYESDGLPDDYLGTLLVTSWGDHRIDRFRLEPKGASFTSRAEPIIVGGQDFRPVGLAVAPDGSLYCTDWVLRDYKLHGKGRVWRISAVDEPDGERVDPEKLASFDSTEELRELLDSPHLQVRRSAARTMATSGDATRRILLETFTNANAPIRARIEALSALRETHPRNLDNLDQLLAADPAWPEREQHLASELRALRGVGFSFQDTYPLDAALRLGIDKDSGSCDPFLFAAAVDRIARSDVPAEQMRKLIQRYPTTYRPALRPAEVPQVRLAYYLGARSKFPASEELAELGLKAESPELRRAAVQWVAEENLRGLRSRVEQILDEEPMTPDLFSATLAALSMLDGVPPSEFEKKPPTERIASIVRDVERPASIRTLALSLLPSNAEAFGPTLAEELLSGTSRDVRLEAIRTLQLVSAPWAAEPLRAVAADLENDDELLAEAIVGLATHRDQQTRNVLRQLLASREVGTTVHSEAIRSLRGAAADDADVRDALLEEGRKLQRVALVAPEVREKADQLALALDGVDAELPWGITNYRSKRPAASEQWLELLKDGGDPAAGRRVFFHPNSAGCSKCHTVHARGGNVGPDLSVIARTMDRKKLAESILEPSQEVSPQFTGWTFVMTSGKVHTGLTVGEGPGDVIHVGTSDGAVVTLKRADIEERLPQTTSIMPDKLEERLTPGEFRDLLAFLETLK